MNKLLCTGIFCFTLSLAPALAAGEYSLTDLYSIALERSETIKIAEEEYSLSRLEQDRALSDLLPTFSAFGEHIRYSEEQRQGGFLLQPDYTNEWGVRLDETLSLGGREFTSYRISREGVRKSGFDVHAVKEGYLFDVATQYYVVLRAKRGLEIAAANVERLTKHRDAAKRRREVGEATRTVLLRAEAELAGARSDLVKAENDLKIGKATLAKTVGIVGDYDVSEPRAGIDYKLPADALLTIEIITRECQLTIIDCLKEMALSERAEMQSLAIQKDIAGDGVKAAQSSYWPDLSIEGVYLRQENEPSSSFELSERIYGGVRLDFPFFEWGRKRADVGTARGRLKQAEYRLRDVENTIKREVENAYHLFIREGSVLTHLQAELEFAQENYESITKQFQYGLADSIDAIDANTLLVTSERDLVNAQYIYQLSILRLKRVTGILLKEFMGETEA